MELLAEYEGNYTRWHDNGNLWVQACKKNGKFEGECREWYENGQLCEYGFYRNGLQEGKHKTWNEDGKIFIDEIFQNGLREGVAILWYRDGENNSCARELYRNGKRQGESVYWNTTLGYYPSRFYFYDGYVIDPHFNLRKRRIFLRCKKSYLPMSRTAINNFLIKDLLSVITT
jgi:hypothetical protein